MRWTKACQKQTLRKQKFVYVISVPTTRLVINKAQIQLVINSAICKN